MKKDVIIAILIGFAFGAIFALIIVNLPMLIKSGNDKYKSLLNKKPPVVTQIPNEDNLKSPVLTVSNPQDNMIATADKIKVLGKTESGALVVMDSSSDSTAMEASGDGSFAFSLTLNEGRNEIVLTSFTKDGNSKSINLNSFYTPEKL